VVLKQFAFVLGPENFRNGLRVYVKDHAYSNAEWSDLVHALEEVSGRSLGRWAEMWIRHRGHAASRRCVVLRRRPPAAIVAFTA
jgi:aminopeptidase N